MENKNAKHEFDVLYKIWLRKRDLFQLFPDEMNEGKNTLNIAKHGLSFYKAQDTFFDTQRVILNDATHSSGEKDTFALAKQAEAA
jgi:hypothetical protein